MTSARRKPSTLAFPSRSAPPSLPTWPTVIHWRRSIASAGGDDDADHDGQKGGSGREAALATMARPGIRAGAGQAERLRRHRAVVRKRARARMDDPAQARRARRIPPPRARLFL